MAACSAQKPIQHEATNANANMHRAARGYLGKRRVVGPNGWESLGLSNAAARKIESASVIAGVMAFVRRL
jgi:hypothetical protein